MERKTLDDLLGWYGAGAILIAYALTQFEILEVEDLAYQILNVTGALGIVYTSFKKRAYQPAVLNLVWTLIGCVAIIRILLTPLMNQPL